MRCDGWYLFCCADLALEFSLTASEKGEEYHPIPPAFLHIRWAPRMLEKELPCSASLLESHLLLSYQTIEFISKSKTRRQWQPQLNLLHQESYKSFSMDQQSHHLLVESLVWRILQIWIPSATWHSTFAQAAPP